MSNPVKGIDFEKALKDLRTGEVELLFIKKSNGEHRRMKATRNPDIIGNFLGDEGKEKVKDAEDKLEKQRGQGNLTVLDLDKREFRTIPLGNVLSWEA